MTDHTAFPDYRLDDWQDLTSPAQIKAIADATRQTILGLLGERAATTSQLADLLQQPKGTVGHHLAALQRAGLIRVVRTRQVRALTEKYYGRVARQWRIAGVEGTDDVVQAMVEEWRAERVPADTDPLGASVLVHGRMSIHDAEEFARRIHDVAQEFQARVEPGEPVFGFFATVYKANWPALKHSESESGDDRQS